MCTVKIENALYFDGEKIRKGTFSIVSGKITFDNCSNPSTKINGDGYFFMPGLVNAHHHTYSTLARGVPFKATIRNFYENLAYFWWRWDASLDEEGVYYSALVGAIESVRKGVTTIFDHHASFSFIDGSLSVLKEAFEKVGVRGVVCFEASDRLGRESALKSIRENERFIKEDESQFVKGVIGLHANFTVSDDMLALAREIAERYRRPIHVHVSEDRFDRDLVIAKYGIPPVMRLAKANILKDALLAHVIWVYNDELDLIKDQNAYILHNPESNMNNNVGYFNVHEIFKRDIGVLLGTDGFSHSVIMQYRSAVLNAQARGINGYALFPEVLRNNFKLANRLLKVKLGKIEEGYDGDVVGFRYTPFTPLDDRNVFSHIFFDLPEKEADFVIVGGKPIIIDGKFVYIDEVDIKEKAREVARSLWNKFLNNKIKFSLPNG